jgi:hypothetical protein
MLKETSAECRALLARLSNTVTTDNSLHKVVNDGLSQDFEVYQRVELFLKVKIKERVLPVSI